MPFPLHKSICFFPKGVHESNTHTSNRRRTTKYRWWNFPFLLLWRFLKECPAFICSLLVTGITFLGLTSREPFFLLIPAVGKMSVLFYKEIKADWRRWRLDLQTNQQIYETYKFPEDAKKPTTYEKLKVGDLVILWENDLVPADLLLIHLSGDSPKAIFDASHLDGETTQKSSVVHPAIASRVAGGKDLYKQEFYVGYQTNKPDFRIATGCFGFGDDGDDGQTWVYGIQNLLLQGAVLKSGGPVIGIVLYNGEETKVALNFQSRFDKNSALLWKFNVLCGYVGVLCVALALIYGLLSRFYDGRGLTHAATKTLTETCLSYVVIFYQALPLNLFVTFEVLKQVFAQQIDSSWTMTLLKSVEETGRTTSVCASILKGKTEFQQSLLRRDLMDGVYTSEPGVTCLNSDLIEELGHVDHIFADKTGTLTLNQMEVSTLVAAHEGALYKYKLREMPEIQSEYDRSFEKLQMFGLCINLCHDVHLTSGSWQGLSSDETALVRAQVAGISLEYRSFSKKKEIIKLKSPIKDYEFEVLHKIDFSSDTRKMSVVVKSVQGNIWSFVKGADEVIEKKCGGFSPETQQSIVELGNEGLRILAFGYKWMSASEWSEIREQIDKEGESECTTCRIESDLTFLGLSGIKDHLQENVAEALAKFPGAQISLWVLTGDRISTTVQTLRAAKVLKESTQIFEYPEVPNDDQLDDFGIILHEKQLERLDACQVGELVALSSKANAIISCRLNPLQKSKLLKMVQKHNGQVCLAIGDGDNDAPMLQTADIGVFMQCLHSARAPLPGADFSLLEFQFLVPLILHYGRRNFRRLSSLVNFNFFINSTFLAGELIFGFQSYFDGTHGYLPFNLFWFDLSFSGVAALVPFSFEFDVPATLCIRHPEVYLSGKVYKQILKSRRALVELLKAIVQGAIIWVVSVRSFTDGSLEAIQGRGDLCQRSWDGGQRQEANLEGDIACVFMFNQRSLPFTVASVVAFFSLFTLVSLQIFVVHIKSPSPLAVLSVIFSWIVNVFIVIIADVNRFAPVLRGVTIYIVNSIWPCMLIVLCLPIAVTLPSIYSRFRKSLEEEPLQVLRQHMRRTRSPIIATSREERYTFMRSLTIPGLKLKYQF